jgi:hypothetical protein
MVSPLTPKTIGSTKMLPLCVNVPVAVLQASKFEDADFKIDAGLLTYVQEICMFVR